MIPVNLYNTVSDPTYINLPKFLPIQMLLHHDPITGAITNKFSGTDNPDLFKKNLVKQPADWHYRFKEIEYKVNSSGYRCPEWTEIDWKESIVIFGCSNVAGIGLAEDETVGYNLSQLLDRPVINLGAPGSSVDFSFYNANILAEHYPIPYAVVNLWTTFDRCCYFEKEMIRFVGPWDTTPYYREFVRNEQNPIMHAKMLAIASKNLWNDRTRYYAASFFDRSAYYTQTDWIEIDNRARDLLHPGRNNTKEMAKLIAQHIS